MLPGWVTCQGQSPAKVSGSQHTTNSVTQCPIYPLGILPLVIRLWVRLSVIVKAFKMKQGFSGSDTATCTLGSTSLKTSRLSVCRYSSLIDFTLISSVWWRELHLIFLFIYLLILGSGGGGGRPLSVHFLTLDCVGVPIYSWCPVSQEGNCLLNVVVHINLH